MTEQGHAAVVVAAVTACVYTAMSFSYSSCICAHVCCMSFPSKVIIVTDNLDITNIILF